MAIDGTVSLHEAAERLGIDTREVLDLWVEGRVSAAEMGGEIRVDEESVERLAVERG